MTRDLEFLKEKGIRERQEAPGIAGGVLGIGPLLAGCAALTASAIMMAVGHAIGKRFHAALTGKLDVRLLSCTLFALLAIAQVEDQLRAEWHKHIHSRNAAVVAVVVAVLTLAVGLVVCTHRSCPNAAPTTLVLSTLLS